MKFKDKIILLMLFFLFGGCSRASQDSFHSKPDSIDLFILREANQIWDTFGANIWQYFNPEKIPVLLFQSTEQQWLLNHPNPPTEYKNSSLHDFLISHKPFGSKPIWNYPTATIWVIFDSWTTILPSHSAWKHFCEQRNIPSLIFSPDQLVFISLHERFHAYQMQWLEDEFKKLLQVSSFNSPPKSRDELLSDIPENSDEATLCLQEQHALYNAYIEKDAIKSKFYISEFLTFRKHRLKIMNRDDIDIEQYMELVEGTAQYIEFRLSDYFQNGYNSDASIRNHPDFQNYKNATLSPTLSVQKAKNGVLTTDRVYTTGTLICILLDRFSDYDWKQDIFKNYKRDNTNLGILLSNCL